MDIIKKSQEWAAQYGSLLRASATTRFPTLYKGAVGGLEHVISVDNGAAYMELWRDGTGSYYATTGAAIKQMPGLAKGAALDEALDKFFALTSKLAKGKTYRDRQGVTQPSARKRSPFKKAGTTGQHSHSYPGTGESTTHSHQGTRPGTQRPEGVDSGVHHHYNSPAHRKNYAAGGGARFHPAPLKRGVTDDPSKGPYGGPKPMARKAVPGPSRKYHSHPAYQTSHPIDRPHRAMSPGSHEPFQQSARGRTWSPTQRDYVPTGAAKKGIVEKVDPEIGPSFSVGHIKPSDLSPESSVSKLIKAILHHDLGEAQTPPSKPKPSGEQPWEDAAKRDIPPMQESMGPRPPKGSSRYRRPRQAQKDIVGLSGGMGKPPRVKQGFGDPARVNKPVGRGPRLITNIEGGRSTAGGGTSPVKPASGPGSPVGYGSTGQPQYSYARKAGFHYHDRKQGGGGHTHAPRPEGHSHVGEARKAGSVFQPKKPPQTYRSGQGFSGRRMGGPGSKSPAVAAPPRPNTRFGKACSPCREVAKAVRAASGK